ncbi:MAG: aminopeptidase P N-terminal domain-containing protein [Bacteroidales bacterium]|nr:aminopeptidase P N-terminal domain-containing protein [Bacteroidales bacterium]
MRHPDLPTEMFVRNRLNFSQMLPGKSLALFIGNEKMLRNGDQYFPFRQQSDFFYLTGISQEKAILMLFPDSPDPLLREVLFIEAYSALKAQWEGYMLSAEDARRISGVPRVLTHGDFASCLREAMSHTEEVFLYSYEYPRFLPETESIQLKFAHKIREQYPMHTYRRSAPLLDSLRPVKSEHEIALIKEACRITGLGFRKLLHTTRPGRFEFELEADLSHLFTTHRCNGHGYHPIIAGGINACTLHYNANNSALAEGELLLLDFGAEYANYSADLSRTIPVSGKFSPRQKQCYEAVLRVFKKAIPLYRTGNTIASINEAVWKMMEQEMIGLGLFSQTEVEQQSPENPLYKKYLMHGVAHHIGLDVHDTGSRYAPLVPGMVLTLEPGIYIPDENIGIRIENDILITADGPVDLMADIPIEAEEIESLMS